MPRKILAVIALLPLVIASAAVAREDVFAQGPWSGNCGDSVQCKVDFVKHGKNYQMKVKVADRADSKAIICEFDALMKPLAYDVLVGDLKGDEVRVAYMRTTDVVISGLPKDECSGAVVNGPYRQYLDE
jgi:hypothetical protein